MLGEKFCFFYEWLLTVIFYVFISFSYVNKLELVHMAYITYIHFSKEECEQIVFLIT